VSRSRDPDRELRAKAVLADVAIISVWIKFYRDLFFRYVHRVTHPPYHHLVIGRIAPPHGFCWIGVVLVSLGIVEMRGDDDPGAFWKTDRLLELINRLPVEVVPGHP